MPILNITEYIDTSNGNPIEPPCAHQTVELGESVTASAVFHKNTRCVRIATDVNCLVSISNEDVAPQSFLSAGEKELRIVYPGAGYRIVASLAPADMQSDSDRLTHLIALITNPKAAAARKAELEKIETSIKRKTETLRKEQKTFAEEKAKYEAELEEFTKQSAAFREFFEKTNTDLTAREVALADASKAFNELSSLTAIDLAAREEVVRNQEDQFAGRNRALAENERKVAALRNELERRLDHIKAATGPISEAA